MCDYCALSPSQRRVLLNKFRAHLRAGGALLFDVYSLAALAARKGTTSYAPNLHDGFWAARPYFGFANTYKYETERVALDKFTIVEETRVRTVYNWLQYFDRETLRAEVEARGLVVEEVLGDVAGGAYDPASHELAVVVRQANGR